MISLGPDEVIILQVDASGSGRHDSFKLKGTLFVTNQRIVFRDHKKGTLLDLDYIEELLGYSALKKDRLVIDWQKNGGTGKMEFEVDDDAGMLEAKIREAQDNARKMAKMQRATPATATASSEIGDDSAIKNELISLLYNYDVDSYNKYNTLEDNSAHLKPYINTKLGNLTYASWHYSDPIELVWLISRKHAETAYRTVMKFHPEALDNASSEFLDKIATEAIRLKFTIDRSKIGKDYNYDPLRTKILEIDSYLIGITVTHNDSYYVLHPDHYRVRMEDSHGPRNYKEDQDAWNELVNAWKEWRIVARGYDVGAKKAKDKIYELTKKWNKDAFGDEAEKEYYSWLAEDPERAYLELYTAYLEAVMKKGIQPKEPVTPVIPDDEIIITDFSDWDAIRKKGLFVYSKS